ncbi:aldehyde dehydrogenase [Agromyces protaetiae]|uniref:Aldehyde dehydrogenase n=2 Tax=Agromyces protaetiae TaxID=2509455 RepID=A0A4P6FKB8_9MICO|nr:aldehyde dehydrogenase [Agromyces protaetiae]
MNTAMDMMKGAMSMKDSPMQGMDMMMMSDVIEALSACEQACVMCADADAGEGMARCAGMCSNCADMCNTMMRMMLRPNGMDMAVMMSMMESTMAMCRACSAECMMHAEMSEHCRLCAMACDQAAMALEKMLGSMREMMPTM